MDNATIIAVATAPGRGGIGIVRLSGPKARQIGETMTGLSFNPRHAHHAGFTDQHGQLIDEGLALYFPGPHSFTGEDVVELQGHGGPVVLDTLVQTGLQLGARLAQPGEFSQRAFLNNKLDLAQAEAIADLIDASSRQGARNAINSLQGVFSKRVHELVDGLTQLRIYVEAAIDFPEEEIDFLSDGVVNKQLNQLKELLNQLITESRQGVIIREGIRVAIAGRPNAGKSSLLNALAGTDSAIVTDIEGTTRDLVREQINIDGMPLHLIDTAGLRNNPDKVERIGIERAQQAFETADRILLVVDSQQTTDFSLANVWPDATRPPDKSKITLIANKIDLTADPKSDSTIKEGETDEGIPLIYLSATRGDGMALLNRHLKALAGFTGTAEGGFTARRRHLDALERAAHYLDHGTNQLATGAGELLAEDLRAAQQSLGEITGAVSADELLGKIFSSFCIGK